jgi:hypothetical protein
MYSFILSRKQILTFKSITYLPITFLAVMQNSYLCIKAKSASFSSRVGVFWPRRSRGLKTGEDKRHFLEEVIKFFRRPHELRSKRHWKNYKFILYLPFSNTYVDKFINTY